MVVSLKPASSFTSFTQTVASLAAFWKHIAEVLLEFCQAVVDLLHTYHLLFGEQCAGMRKTLVHFFQKFFILSFEFGLTRGRRRI